MTPEAPGAARRFWRGFNRGRHRFRRWRRGRPFWGGLFLLLGGVQLFLSTQLSLIDVEISFGTEGFLAVVLPLVLLLCGNLLWVTPQHRHFYSIIGTVTAIYSLLGLNLGGWFLGMLFGIIGGALGFSWTPASPVTPTPPATGPAPDSDVDPDSAPDSEPQPDPRFTDPDERPTEDLTGPLTDLPPGADQQAPVRAPRPDPHTYAAIAVPLLLAAALAAPAPQPVPAQLPCLIPVLCPDETPEPDPEDPEPTPGPSEPVPTPGPTGNPEPTDPPAGEDGDDADDPAEPSPSAEPSPIPTVDPPAGQPLVAAEPALMTADRLSQQNFLFEGITELATANGPVRVLQFSFSRSVATNFVLATTVDGTTTRIIADPLVIAGDVTFYTSRFQGRLLGALPLDLTPDSPVVDLLELVDIPLPVFFTDVNLDLVFTSGAELTAEGFRLSL